jgi:hypothetical protein
MMIMGWRSMVVCILAMIGAIALALVLIEPLSLPAAIRGGAIAIGVFLATQLSARLARSRSAR